MVCLTKNLIRDNIKGSVLNLKAKNITSIKIDAFRSFTDLTDLDLSGNNLTKIGLEFDSLVNLKKLNLSVNDIKSINNNAFHNLVDLEVIDLSKNKLKGKISEHLFEGLTNLTKIYLNSNNFGERLCLVLENRVNFVSFGTTTRCNQFEKIDNGLFYKMNHTRRGFALLIINSFQNDKDLALPGSENDIKGLDKLLEDTLCFEVKIEKDKTAAEIKELLKKYAAHEQNKDSDCFLCVISSHGDNEGIIGSDEEILDVKKEILNSFQNSLIGKPKLFFINTCRGKKKMKAAPVSIRPAGSIASEIPTHSDILISYSTVEDFVSFGNSNGSCFIQSLVKMLTKYHMSTHLIDILTRVNNDVSKIEANKSKQMPSLAVCTLRKWVLFE